VRLLVLAKPGFRTGSYRFNRSSFLSNHRERQKGVDSLDN